MEDSFSRSRLPSLPIRGGDRTPTFSHLSERGSYGKIRAAGFGFSSTGPRRSGVVALLGRELRRSRAASLRPSVINDAAPVFLQWRRHRATIKSRFCLHRSNGRVQSPRPSRKSHCRAAGTWEVYNFLDAEFPVATSGVRITAVRRAPIVANGEMLRLKWDLQHGLSRT